MAIVYRFKVFDPIINDWIVELAKGSQARIAALKGRIIEGTGEDVDPTRIDPEGRYIPAE